MRWVANSPVWWLQKNIGPITVEVPQFWPCLSYCTSLNVWKKSPILSSQTERVFKNPFGTLMPLPVPLGPRPQARSSNREGSQASSTEQILLSPVLLPIWPFAQSRISPAQRSNSWHIVWTFRCLLVWRRIRPHQVEYQVGGCAKHLRESTRGNHVFGGTLEFKQNPAFFLVCQECFSICIDVQLFDRIGITQELLQAIKEASSKKFLRLREKNSLIPFFHNHSQRKSNSGYLRTGRK